VSGGIITSAVTGLAGSLVGALDDLFTSDEERAAARLRLEQQLMQPQVIQAMTTLKEAEHASVFVAGWRPGLGWVAVAGLAWEFLVRPLLASGLTVASLWGVDPTRLIQAAADLPHLDAEQLMALVAVLLGVAGYRTFEKAKGVARSR
jgi:hypothetical protein